MLRTNGSLVFFARLNRLLLAGSSPPRQTAIGQELPFNVYRGTDRFDVCILATNT
ncbi:hypothetical protein PS723_01203 [Pseudomonas fluorescens]|uniref:Uncharacterized protein n=1 Tax=Pseudomonas fluorescens TaxID=294 RepID=A0A5E7BA02_PSEFL|nr:hypothetical protein PS723_01203 [Pseudomonas fluorescens]